MGATTNGNELGLAPFALIHSSNAAATGRNLCTLSSTLANLLSTVFACLFRIPETRVRHSRESLLSSNRGIVSYFLDLGDM
jgi:hypothetical protein